MYNHFNFLFGCCSGIVWDLGSGLDLDSNSGWGSFSALEVSQSMPFEWWPYKSRFAMALVPAPIIKMLAADSRVPPGGIPVMTMMMGKCRQRRLPGKWLFEGVATGLRCFGTVRAALLVNGFPFDWRSQYSFCHVGFSMSLLFCFPCSPCVVFFWQCLGNKSHFVTVKGPTTFVYLGSQTFAMA